MTLAQVIQEDEAAIVALDKAMKNDKKLPGAKERNRERKDEKRNLITSNKIRRRRLKDLIETKNNQDLLRNKKS